MALYMQKDEKHIFLIMVYAYSFFRYINSPNVIIIQIQHLLCSLTKMCDEESFPLMISIFKTQPNPRIKFNNPNEFYDRSNTNIQLFYLLCFIEFLFSYFMTNIAISCKQRHR